MESVENVDERTLAWLRRRITDSVSRFRSCRVCVFLQYTTRPLQPCLEYFVSPRAPLLLTQHVELLLCNTRIVILVSIDSMSCLHCGIIVLQCVCT